MNDTTDEEFALEEAARIRMLLGTTELTPISEEEERILRERLPVWERLFVAKAAKCLEDVEDLERVREDLALMEAPLVTEEGEVPFAPHHKAWLKEFSMERALFASPEELREAREAVEAHFNDGKGFSTLRWLAMTADLYAKRAREEAQKPSDEGWDA